MSAPPNQGYGQYPDPAQGQPGAQQPLGDQSTQAPPQQEAVAAGGKKKKRAYAAGAFDVGSGANAGVGGQLSAGGQFGMPPAPQYGGYPQQPEQPQQGYQQPQAYGAPGPQAHQQPAYGGYQAPTPGQAPAPAPGVGGITQGMANMQVGGQQRQQSQGQAQAARQQGPLNQLYPTDLLNQPFNVSELDLPPPPIILPPNVSVVPVAR